MTRKHTRAIRKRNAKVDCKTREVRREYIEDYVLREILRVVLADERIPGLVKCYQELYAERMDGCDGEQLILKAAIKECEKKINNLVSVMASTGSAALVSALEKQEAEKQRLEAELAAAEHDMNASLLTEERVVSGGAAVREAKGIMAGTPLSAFYANLYLTSLDRRFEALGVPYARYSDDIILFAPDRAGAEKGASEVRAVLEDHGLRLNPAKEEFFDPAEGWVFLGFHCRGSRVDIAPVSVEKLKGKMRRKTRALLRWQARNDRSGEQAARAFLRVFNRTLLESPPDNDLSWSRWFFPLITTADSLRAIDRYAQDCLRWLVSGKRTKGRFDVRYEDLKRLGYRSLVHEYYAFNKEE